LLSPLNKSNKNCYHQFSSNKGITQVDSIRDFTNEQGQTFNGANTGRHGERNGAGESSRYFAFWPHLRSPNSILAQHATQTGDITPKALGGFKAQTLVV
jgi:hypothetical protein